MSATLVASALSCSGCSFTKDVYQKGTAGSKDLYQGVVRSWRSVGEKIVASPEETEKKQFCSQYEENVLLLEDAETIPERVSPGEKINNRIRYAFCPYQSAKFMRCSIIKTISYENKRVFQDIKDHKFRPGTWTIDAYFPVPEEADAGRYTLGIDIDCGRKHIKGSSSFVVKK